MKNYFFSSVNVQYTKSFHNLSPPLPFRTNALHSRTPIFLLIFFSSTHTRPSLSRRLFPTGPAPLSNRVCFSCCALDDQSVGCSSATRNNADWQTITRGWNQTTHCCHIDEWTHTEPTSLATTSRPCALPTLGSDCGRPAVVITFGGGRLSYNVRPVFRGNVFGRIILRRRRPHKQRSNRVNTTVTNKRDTTRIFTTANR